MAVNLITLTEKQYFEGQDGQQLTGDDRQYGNYQFMKIDDVINDVLASYCQQGQILEGVRKSDVSYHAYRSMQELSFDTFRSVKSMEIEIPPSLVMALPIDFVGYTKVTYKGDDGIERTLMPAIVTSNPTPYQQDNDYYIEFDNNGAATHASDSNTWFDYHGNTVNTGVLSGNTGVATPHQTDADQYDIYDLQEGQRFGSEPRHMNAHGSFYIDYLKGRLHLSGNLVGRVITLKYISDGVGTLQTGVHSSSPYDTEIHTEQDMIVHKFAQEAMIKHVLYGCMQARMQQPPGMLALLKREKFAETRKAKIRLSNIKIEEIAQIMRGKSKWIKH
tara:strand:- start:1821 stop:2816 length:996 start_codon:yes stop_codon:yes gene_type:complete